MAWQAKITQLERSRAGWRIVVEYYDDANPLIRFERLLTLPQDATKADALALVKTRGAEIRAQARLAGEQIVGQVIQIP